MSVVTEQGLVGKTTTVSESISIVLLVSDENRRSRPPWKGRASRGSLPASASGALTPLLDLNFVERPTAAARKYTSGWAGFFQACSLERSRTTRCGN
jgi:hypothetical protein